jgi:hypothetical protein
MCTDSTEYNHVFIDDYSLVVSALFRSETKGFIGPYIGSGIKEPDIVKT